MNSGASLVLGARSLNTLDESAARLKPSGSEVVVVDSDVSLREDVERPCKGD